MSKKPSKNGQNCRKTEKNVENRSKQCQNFRKNEKNVKNVKNRQN